MLPYFTVRGTTLGSLGTKVSPEMVGARYSFPDEYLHCPGSGPWLSMLFLHHKFVVSILPTSCTSVFTAHPSPPATNRGLHRACIPYMHPPPRLLPDPWAGAFCAPPSSDPCPACRRHERDASQTTPTRRRSNPSQSVFFAFFMTLHKN